MRVGRVPDGDAAALSVGELEREGAVEAVATVLTLRDQIIHPTINLEQPDPLCDLDYVPNVARPAKIDVALSNSFGFGGINAVIALRRWK